MLKRLSLFLIGFFVAFQAGLDSIPDSSKLMLDQMSEIPLKVWLSGIVGGLVGATSTAITPRPPRPAVKPPGLIKKN